MSRLRFGFLLLLLFTGKNQLFAQQNDFGLWVGYQAQFTPYKKFRIVLAPEFRFDQNALNLDRFLTDAGLEYRALPWLHISGFYRFILRNRRDYFDQRHRFYANLNLQKELGKIEIIYRLRYQNQFTDFGVFRAEGIGNSYFRHKFGSNFNLPRKLTAGVTADFWFATQAEHLRSNHWRLTTSLAWDQSKKKRWEIAFLRDQALNVSNPLTAYLVQLGFKQKF